ncbi:MAG: acyl-CoA desaturase, partial [Gammaproteobacteria bacterium]
MTSKNSFLGGAFWAWLTNDPVRVDGLKSAERDRLDPVRTGAFALMHVAVLGVIWVGISPAAVTVALGLYVARMFFITAFYHRFFAHKSFRAGRWTTFLMGVLGCTAAQRGPLWWAGHHRLHHQFADTGDDPHSPDHRGLFWSHTLWF